MNYVLCGVSHAYIAMTDVYLHNVLLGILLHYHCEATLDHLRLTYFPEMNPTLCLNVSPVTSAPDNAKKHMIMT